MKYLLIVFFCFGCSDYVPKSEYVKLTDSIQVLNIQQAKCIEHGKILQDSVNYLKQWVIMTKDQRERLNKYDRLYKYFRICENNPTQWANYKGWSIRVFTQ